MFERLLIRYPLFELLPPQIFHSILSDSVTVEFQTGEVLFQEGANGAWVHLLLEGRVRILRRADSGRDVSLGIVQAGELFGEYVLLTPHLHTATCRTSSACRVLRIPLGKCREYLHDAGVDGATLKQFIRLHASMNFLAGRHYLGFMSAPSALTYAELLKLEHFRAMRTLCAAGLAKDRWFLITEGQAVLTDRLGRMLELGPGDCFGSLCLAGRPADETVSTLTDIRCLSLRVSDFANPSPTTRRASGENDEQNHGDREQTLLSRLSVKTSFPFCSQIDEMDCGLASLAMITEYLGLNLKDRIYQHLPTLSSSGTSLLHLRDMARSLSLDAEAYRVDSDHLADLQCPFIAHLNDGHYFVVCSVTENSILVADPATSLHSISHESLISRWSGYVLFLQIAAAGK